MSVGKYSDGQAGGSEERQIDFGAGIPPRHRVIPPAAIPLLSTIAPRNKPRLYN